MHAFYETQKDNLNFFSAQNFSFPCHLHHTVELLYIQEGSVEVTVQNTARILTKGCSALVFPDMIHGYRSIGYSQVAVCIFRPGNAKDYYHLFRSSYPADPFLDADSLHPDVALGFSKMLDFSGQSEVLVESWLHLILAYLLPGMKLLPLETKNNTDITYQLIQYISLHFQQHLTLDDIAREIHFNKNYISRVFSRKLHCGFYEYVNQIRLDYAAQQIRMTDNSITAIWQDAGFESQRTFNRVFHRCFDMSPKEYRKHITILLSVDKPYVS